MLILNLQIPSAWTRECLLPAHSSDNFWGSVRVKENAIVVFLGTNLSESLPCACSTTGLTLHWVDKTRCQANYFDHSRSSGGNARSVHCVSLLSSVGRYPYTTNAKWCLFMFDLQTSMDFSSSHNELSFCGIGCIWTFTNWKWPSMSYSYLIRAGILLLCG